MAKHPPAHRRELLRRLRAGEHPTSLLREAATIDDPGHAAAAMFTLSADRRVPSQKAGEALVEVRKLLRRVDRPGRVAEAWQEILAELPEWRPGQHEATKDQIIETALRAVEKMPDGQWTRDAIEAMAPHVGASGRQRLLRRSLENQGFEITGGKAVIRCAASGEARQYVALIDAAAPEIASALHAYIAGRGEASPDAAIANAWAIEDRDGRAEALRVLAWNAADAADLDALAKSATEQDDADAVRLLTVVAARADRIGLPDVADRFARAQVRANALPEGHKLRRKLADAMQRAGLEVAVESPPAKPAPPAEAVAQAPATDIPVAAATRHTFALVDGYQGGLGPAHVRALARAAPLCDAFGLDLALVGFPTKSADELVQLAEADSSIGEGGGHARRLLEAGRLTLIPLEGGLPEAWPGQPVATTPHPKDDGAGLESFRGPICLLVGVGRQGLPRKLLNAVPDHYELTGQGISLETATAMGILADRLGRVRITS